MRRRGEPGGEFSPEGKDFLKGGSRGGPLFFWGDIFSKIKNGKVLFLRV